MIVHLPGQKQALAMKRVAAGGRPLTRREQLAIERSLAETLAEADRLQTFLKTHKPRRAK